MAKIYLLILMVFTIACQGKNASGYCNQGSQTVVNEGDVSDMSVYSPLPYFEDGAGYQETTTCNFESLPEVDFQAKEGAGDSKRLEKLIDSLSTAGGGSIRIKKGHYRLRDVRMMSNIKLVIEPNTTIRLEKQNEGNNKINGERYFFNLCGRLDGKPVENIIIIGEGTPETRPKLYLKNFIEFGKNTMNRAISVTYVKNALLENLTIVDEFTKGAAIALNPADLNHDGQTAYIPENVTVANISLTKGSIGYGLVQTNVGRNVLLKNLSCQGGMTCRIEAHTGRKYDLGVYNIVVKNVASINGKAAVLLQPHSVINGRVLVDVAKSEGSTWTVFLRRGFVGKDSKRREPGIFAPETSFSNISLLSTDSTATMSYKNFEYVPELLKPFYNPPKFIFNKEDANYGIDKSGVPSRESSILGPSIAAIFTDAQYPVILPSEKDIVISGEIENREKIMRKNSN